MAMVKKLSVTVLSIVLAICLKAQDSTKIQTPTPSTVFTYSIDAYYRSDFAGKSTNNKTSFTNSTNSFELGMASIRVDHSFGKIAATADLGFGRRAQEFSYNDGSGFPTGSGNNYSSLAAVKQAYISYAPTSKLKFTLGKWVTHFDNEVVDAYANRNYSMSYLFTYGPFFHTGVKADISLGGKTALMVGIANPTDFTTTNTSAKMFLAQLSTGTKNDKFKAILNYQNGSISNYSNVNQIDLILLGILSNKFSINYDGTIANIAGKSWNSNVFYFNYDPSNKFGFTLRTEYFDDTKNIVGVGSSVFATTLSANIHIDNLTIIPEIRFDNARDQIFLNSSNANTTGAGNLLVAAVYKF